MSPSMTVNNIPSTSVGDAESFRDGHHGAFLLGENRPDFLHLVPRHLGHAVFFACKRMAGKVVAACAGHVLHVLEAIAKLQVVRIYAVRHITPRATVQHHFVLWNRAAKQKPGSAVRVNFAVYALPALDHPMAFGPAFTTWTGTSSPKPVTFRHMNLAPKAIREALRKPLAFEKRGGNVRAQDYLIHHDSVTLPGVTGLAGAHSFLTAFPLAINT